MTTEEAATPEQPSADERRDTAEKLVKRMALWSGAAGMIPVPFVDMATVGGVQIQMLRRLSRIYDVPFSENRGKSLVAALAGATIPATSGLGAASLLKGLPIAGTIVGALAMPTLSAGATYAIGMAFIQHFASGGTLLDFEPPDYREFIKAQKEKYEEEHGGKPEAAGA
ncbi:MAG: YcjF family protein [Pseudolabrys sp.]